jgi:hypothetical protein
MVRNLNFAVVTLFILLSFLTSVSAQTQCRWVFERKLTFNFKYLKSNEPLTSSGLFYPHIQATPNFQWLSRTILGEVEKFNRQFKNEKRPKSPHTSGLRGSLGTEQWTYYIFENIPEIISNVFKNHLSQFTLEEQQILRGILQVTQMGADLRFSNPKKHNFNLEDAIHRVATTTGKVGDPIYLNEDFFSLVSLDAVTRDPQIGQAKFGDEHYDVRLSNGEYNLTLDTQQIKKLKELNYPETLRSYLAILIHELGHYLNIPDSPERPLDRLGTKVAKLFFDQIEIYDLKKYGQNLSQFQFIPIQRFGSNKQILFLEFKNTFNLTQEVVSFAKSKLGANIEILDFKDLSWEKEHNWDAQIWSYPKSLMLTAIVKLADGGLRELRLRIILEMSVSASMAVDDPTVGINQKNIHSVPNDLELSYNFARISIQERTDKADNQVARSKILQVFESQTVISPQQKWRVSYIVQVPAHAKIKNITAVMSSDQFIWSGYIAKNKFKAQKTWFEYIGANQIMVHMEHEFNPQQVQQSFYLDQLQIQYDDKSIDKLRPVLKKTVQVNTAKGTGRLYMYGFSFYLFEPIRKMKMKPPLKVEMPSGNIFPMSFLLNKSSGFKRIELIAHVLYEEKNGEAQSEGFIVNALDPKNPFVKAHTIESAQNHKAKLEGFDPNENLYLMKLHMGVPSTINGKKVKSIVFENIYILFENNDQIFEPITTTFEVR